MYTAFYKTFMSNSAVYVSVIVAGALVGEKALNYGFDRAWERANKGKLWTDVRRRLELE
ncbi:Cytochrome b-c1 complex subunit 9 [Ostreococcus tauri]|uniref:Complex III subunit 9 n=1 Tax=Ostreococcus tauri TaxID=70448 RepID=Q00X81_OSTTA|nr:Cytochrome b-c1 complex subunit 9 [Ostreococcus tauri]OUS46212.1 ubiquinol--cytochrome-c reductase-like protein [Ostreococcus tauri]CAL56430.1 Cytochrome b-c1 complex subunit 9 [Ostreococcus tauri]|eukprot:XP_003082573.1 Cytochrome b-c1 complex subunit 9 [Ostreococcus tauri]